MNFRYFLIVKKKMPISFVMSVCSSICLSACINSDSTERLSIKLDTGDLTNLSWKYKFDSNQKKYQAIYMKT
jgi:hypothetical protein